MGQERRASVPSILRGVAAALFFSLVIARSATAFAANETGATVLGQSRLADGLTLVSRPFALAPSSALEIWIRCPANGYGASKPGIARLTALALLERKTANTTLREQVHQAGAQIGISVYHEGTEIVIMSPSYISGDMLDKLANQILRPQVDKVALTAARQRLAAQQVAAGEVPDQLLRDSLFARLFANGPLHEPTYGSAQTLATLTLADVNAFLARAYSPPNEMVIAAGGVDPTAVAKQVSKAAPSGASAAAMPESQIAANYASPLTLNRASAHSAGVAMGWVGPPIEDEQAATAMDFLSDYLTYSATGVFAKAINGLDPSATFYGQFVTLRNPGVFFVSATGEKLDPTVAQATIQRALKDVLAAQLSKAEFARALDVFRTHLLRDLQTPQQIADNYGWYFTEGAVAYSPSASDTSLGGDYFSQVQSLTPEIVAAVAKRYLGAQPAIVQLTTGTVHTAARMP